MKRPFKTWLVDEHADADTAVGDLARDVRSDSSFPDEGDHAALRRYLEDVWGADASFLACFEEAWALYEPHPFVAWLLRQDGREFAPGTPLGIFAEEFAPRLPATGDRAALRAVVEVHATVWDHDLADWMPGCFDVAWQQFQPTCDAPGCNNPVDIQMSLCGVHSPLAELL